MLKKLFFLATLGVALITAQTYAYDVASDPDLLGWWTCDEGEGSMVADASGNGHDGTFVEGDPAWVDGIRGSAVELTAPTRVEMAAFNMSLSEATFAGWMMPYGSQPDWSAFLMTRGTATGFNVLGFQLAYHWNDAADTWGFRGGDVIADNEWTFAAITIAPDKAVFYVNGVEGSTNAVSHPAVNFNANLYMGGDTGAARRMTGALDDVSFFGRALAADEIMVVMNGLSDPSLAAAPAPASGAADVPRDVTLNWTSGKYAANHTVYMSTSIEDVNNGSASAQVADAITASSVDVGVLDFGTTYYWRVDEVNGAPDRTVFTGKVWSFDVEPIAVPVETITATASNANVGMDPENTINGSGLNDLGQHSTDPLTMWLAGGANPWIQYEFDKAYKLNELLVWNSNQAIEAFIGFGVKEMTIETSIDGETWTALDGVTTLARASGQSTYDAADVIDMGGLMAKAVKLTVVSAHGFTPQVGLAEVRFLAIPVAAREPQPADGGMSSGVDVELAWRSGREAVSHEVRLGSDADNLALIATTTEATTVTDTLDYDASYAWSVTEVNDAATPTTHAGDVWTFVTPAFGTVDDFESYSAEEGEEVYMTWFDGFGGDASLGGSTTGHIGAPYVETDIVNSGSNAMPVYIDNDGGFFDIDGKPSSPNFSEVVRELAPAQDWTGSGIKTLSIMFSGSSGLTGQLYCKIGGTKLLYDSEATNLGIAAWQAWNIDLSTVGGNLKSVKEIAIGVDGGTSGILYIDDIRLYPKTGETIAPVEPTTANLLAHYTFDGTGDQATDASGNGNHAVVNGGALRVPGVEGTAIELDGTDDYVGTEKQLLNGLGQFSIACWIKGDMSSADRWGLVGQNDCVEYGFNTSNNLQIYTAGGGTVNVDWPYDGADWHHIVSVGDGSAITVYIDGFAVATGGSVTASYGTSTFTVNMGGGGVFDDLGNAIPAALDDVRIYDRALSAEEIVWLSGKREAIYKPF